MTPLQIAVLAILDNALAYKWSVQGFGMLRLYVRDIGRLQIWDSRLRYPNVSMIHTHSWDLRSTVVFGRLRNQRFVKRADGILYSGKRLITGYHTKDVQELPPTSLWGLNPESYGPMDVYRQTKDEIHESIPVDSTVTLLERQEDIEGQADVYWPAGTEWGTAAPRKATDEEITLVVNSVLERTR